MSMRRCGSSNGGKVIRRAIHLQHPTHLSTKMKILIILSAVLLLCTVVLANPAITTADDCNVDTFSDQSKDACKKSVAAKENPCKNVDQKDQDACNKKYSAKSAGFAATPGMVWAMAIFLVMGVNAML